MKKNLHNSNKRFKEYTISNHAIGENVTRNMKHHLLSCC